MGKAKENTQPRLNKHSCEMGRERYGRPGLGPSFSRYFPPWALVCSHVK